MKPSRASVNIFLICFVLCLCTSYVKAQNDTVGLPYPQMLFNAPENFDETVQYSAENRSFTFQKSVGSLNLQRPTFFINSRHIGKLISTVVLLSNFKIKASGEATSVESSPT